MILSRFQLLNSRNLITWDREDGDRVDPHCGIILLTTRATRPSLWNDASFSAMELIGRHVSLP